MASTVVKPESRLRSSNLMHPLRSIGRDDDHLECKYAFLVDQEWFSSNILDEHAVEDILDMEYVPAVLDWAILMDAWIRVSNFVLIRRYVLIIPGLICATCRRITLRDLNSNVIILGITAGVEILFLLIGTWLYKMIKRRKKKIFQRNGGLILQKQLSSGDEGNLEKTKLFTAKELEKATDHYKKNWILGQGGQGTVYKGMLTDGRIVAVKKSKIVDEDKLQEFINEVVILSQINHRNVVKLFGCCLETEVPLLVYEFIPKGTLFKHILETREDEFPFSWAVHLPVAVEVAGDLSYLHSSASIPIYHPDIKSSNILLDDKYQAEVSDFGTSRSVATLELWNFKSDVYSVGVVLVEPFYRRKGNLVT